ncbi:MAG: CNNM domain-containing protein [Elusimicrobiales bacterium]|nr:CNNM domain-containing protein [Elusimicrobiales bacterium]
MDGFTTELIVIALMLVFNAGFAAYEMALASVAKSRIRHLAEKNAPGSASAAFMKDRVEASLSLIQLGITLAGAVAAATGGAGINEYIAPLLQARFALTEGGAAALGIVLFVLPLSFVTIVFGELVPKVFAIENKEFILLAFSPFFRGLYLVCYPLLFVFELVIKAALAVVNALLPADRRHHEKAPLAELRLAAAQARDESAIGHLEERIVNAAAELSHRKVGEMLIPLSAVSSIPATATLPEALVRAHMDLHTRFPVTKLEGPPEEFIGYINFKDIVNALKMQAKTPDVAAITRPIEKVRAGALVPRALEDMMSKNVHMALVTDDSGNAVGLLTLEDIISQLVGQKIKDEYDRLPSYLYAAGGGLIAGGGADMAEILRKLGLPPGAANVTLAAWLEKRLGRAPKGSELVKAAPIEVLVRKTRRHRVSEAFIRKTPAAI